MSAQHHASSLDVSIDKVERTFEELFRLLFPPAVRADLALHYRFASANVDKFILQTKLFYKYFHSSPYFSSFPPLFTPKYSSLSPETCKNNDPDSHVREGLHTNDHGRTQNTMKSSAVCVQETASSQAATKHLAMRCGSPEVVTETQRDKREPFCRALYIYIGKSSGIWRKISIFAAVKSTIVP